MCQTNNNNSNEKKHVAWIVRDGEDQATIVFQSHGLAARRIGASELNIDFESAECSRESKYDGYASKGSVPSKVLIENGWWFECDHCQTKLCEYFEEDTNKTIVYDGMRTYCDEQCRLSRLEEIELSNAKFESFKKDVQKLRPDLTFTKYEGGYPMITMIAEFDFKGSKYGGSVRDQNGDGELGWSVAHFDVTAWSEYEKERADTKKEA